MAAQKTMTLDEFLAWELDQKEKHEYYRGLVYLHPQYVAMPGASSNHHEIEVNLIREVAVAFEDSTFRPYTSNQMVVSEAGGSAFYPDVVLLDGPREFRKYGKLNSAANPAVVFEIASPGTDGYDRGHKLETYKNMPTMREIILVKAMEARVERFLRTENGWLHESFEGLDAELPVLDVRIPLKRIYKNVDVPPFSLGIPVESEES
jgi:Uma2 family endonuclease